MALLAPPAGGVVAGVPAFPVGRSRRPFRRPSAVGGARALPVLAGGVYGRFLFRFCSFAGGAFGRLGRGSVGRVLVALGRRVSSGRRCLPLAGAVFGPIFLGLRSGGGLPLLWRGGGLCRGLGGLVRLRAGLAPPGLRGFGLLVGVGAGVLAGGVRACCGRSGWPGVVGAACLAAAGLFCAAPVPWGRAPRPWWVRWCRRCWRRVVRCRWVVPLARMPSRSLPPCWRRRPRACRSLPPLGRCPRPCFRRSFPRPVPGRGRRWPVCLPPCGRGLRWLGGPGAALRCRFAPGWRPVRWRVCVRGRRGWWPSSRRCRRARSASGRFLRAGRGPGLRAPPPRCGGCRWWCFRWACRFPLFRSCRVVVVFGCPPVPGCGRGRFAGRLRRGCWINCYW